MKIILDIPDHIYKVITTDLRHSFISLNLDELESLDKAIRSSSTAPDNLDNLINKAILQDKLKYLLDAEEGVEYSSEFMQIYSKGYADGLNEAVRIVNDSKPEV